MKKPGAMLAAAIMSVLGLAVPAAAAISDWAQSEGGQMRLLALSQPRNGRIVAVLEIALNPGWKTYWRNPGDAGMPPQMDFSRSENLSLSGVAYPVPEIGMDEGGRFIGYHEPTKLLLTFDQTDANHSSTLSGDVTVGVCDKICIPFSARFEVPLTPGAPESEEFMAVQMAQAALPAPLSAAFGTSEPAFAADRKTIEGILTLPAGSPAPEIAVHTPVGLELGDAALETMAPGMIRYSLPVTRLGKNYAGGDLVLLVMSGNRAFETIVALKP